MSFIPERLSSELASPIENLRSTDEADRDHELMLANLGPGSVAPGSAPRRCTRRLQDNGVGHDGQDLAIDAELGALRSMPIAGLRSRWRSLFRSDPPKAFGPDLLRHSIAFRIQENAYGGHDNSTRKRLAPLVAQSAGGNRGKISIPRRIKPGAILAREWKGVTHKVTVLKLGFSYGGNIYPSLSEIAREITGTRWNGPRFFGLRPSEQIDPSAKE